MFGKWFFTVAAAVSALMPAQAAEWMTDFEAAKAKAAAEGKMVLVDFTGSDWCHFCIVLRRRVLDTPAFEEWGADKFVYLEVDLPRTTRLPEELLKQNNALVKQYRVGGFPTVIVLDAEGHALGGFTGGMTRLPDVKKALEPALAVHRHIQCARAARKSKENGETDTAVAAHLAAAYEIYPDNYRKFNSWLREELEQCDPHNVYCWKTTYAAEQQMAALDAELPRHIMNRAAMLDCFDRYAAEAIKGNRPRILRMKDQYLTGLAANKLRTARTREEILEARDLQLQAAECSDDPTEQAERKMRVMEVYADPDAMLKNRSNHSYRDR